MNLCYDREGVFCCADDTPVVISVGSEVEMATNSKLAITTIIQFLANAQMAAE